MEKGDVVFRRIRGKIVPIKRKSGPGGGKQIKAKGRSGAADKKRSERNKKLFQGAALTIGGLAVGGAAVFGAAKLAGAASGLGLRSTLRTKRAGRMLNRLKRKTQFGGDPAKNKIFQGILRGAIKDKEATEHLVKGSKALRKAGVFAGSALVGAGVSQAVPQGKLNNASQSLVQETVGLGTAVGLNAIANMLIKSKLRGF